jgi:hypothetical protein
MDDAKKAVDWGINKAQPAINGLKNMKRKVEEKAKLLLPYVDMVLNVTGGGRGLPRGGGAKGAGKGTPPKSNSFSGTVDELLHIVKNSPKSTRIGLQDKVVDYLTALEAGQKWIGKGYYHS